MQLEIEALHKEVAHLQGLLVLAGQPAEPELARQGGARPAGCMEAAKEQLPLRQAQLAKTRISQLERQVLALEGALKVLLHRRVEPLLALAGAMSIKAIRNDMAFQGQGWKEGRVWMQERREVVAEAGNALREVTRRLDAALPVEDAPDAAWLASVDRLVDLRDWAHSMLCRIR